MHHLHVFCLNINRLKFDTMFAHVQIVPCWQRKMQLTSFSLPHSQPCIFFLIDGLSKKAVVIRHDDTCENK